MNKLKISFCPWQLKMRIFNEFAGEYIRKTGIRWLFFEIYVLRQMPFLQLCDPKHRFVTSEGGIFTTESDEQDRLYVCDRTRGFEISYNGYKITLKNCKICICRHVCDRTRGFEISYNGYEITLKNCKICICRHGNDTLEHIHFGDTLLN